MSTPVVDAHAHVFRPASVSPRGTDALAPAERDAPVDRYREHLRSAGIDHAVLVPLDAHDDYVAECVASDPVTFRGIAVASEAELGLRGGNPIDALRRRRERFGFDGVRLLWLGEPGRALAESPVMPLLTHMEETGLILWSYLPPDQAQFLDELGRLLPGLRVVLNHMGFTPADMRVDEHARPWFRHGLTSETVSRVLALARYPGMHLMFSGQYALSHAPYPYEDIRLDAARLVDAFGPQRTLWGSDSPWIDDEPGYLATSRLVEIALPGLSAHDRAAVMGGTAATLFDLPRS